MDSQLRIRREITMKKAQVFIVSALLLSTFAYADDAIKPSGQDKPSGQTANAPATKPARISLKIGYYMGSLKGNESISWTEAVYQENAAYSVDYEAKKGNSFSLGIGYKFTSALGVDLGLDMASRDLGAINSASIPHPLYFNSFREAENVKSYKLKETAISLNLVYSALFGKFELDLFAGPAYFMTSTELTNSITFTESAYPYDTVSISSQSEQQKKNLVGFNAGTSLNYYFSKSVAISAGVRYLSGKAAYEVSTGIPSVSFGLGGLKLGGGLKLVF
jgi:opacity protein-like surface antigen